jgi:phage gpG-like protein
MRVTLTMTGNTLTAAFAHVKGRLADVRPPVTEILSSALRDARTKITSQGRAFGGSFPLLAPSTLRSGRTNETMLNLDGFLLNSLIPGASGNVFEVTEHGGVAGTDIFYAAYQQNGTRAKSEKAYRYPFHIPPRPFLKWRQSRIGVYVNILKKYFVNGEVLAAD